MKAAIVIPAFNEACSIGSVVAAVSAYGTPIVVDDGSGDDTGLRASNAGAIVVRQDVNSGYDAALARGFARADEIGVDVVVTTDADGQLDTAAIPRALEKLAKADLVLGVRDTGAARYSEALFNLYSRARFGVPDILCGFKAFRIERYRSQSHRAAEPSVYTAVALALLRQGVPYELVPVAVRPRAGDVSRFGASWRGEMRIFRAFCAALMDDIGRR